MKHKTVEAPAVQYQEPERPVFKIGIGQSGASPEVLRKIALSLEAAGYRDQFAIPRKYTPPAVTTLLYDTADQLDASMILNAVSRALFPQETQLCFTNFEGIEHKRGELLIFPAKCLPLHVLIGKSQASPELLQKIGAALDSLGWAEKGWVTQPYVPPVTTTVIYNTADQFPATLLQNTMLQALSPVAVVAHTSPLEGFQVPPGTLAILPGREVSVRIGIGRNDYAPEVMQKIAIGLESLGYRECYWIQQPYVAPRETHIVSLPANQAAATSILEAITRELAPKKVIQELSPFQHVELSLGHIQIFPQRRASGLVGVGRTNVSPEILSTIANALIAVGFTEHYWIDQPYEAPVETIIASHAITSGMGGQLLESLTAALAPGHVALELSSFQNVVLPEGHIQIFPARCKPPSQ